jgi:hypothetical protein
MFSRDKSGGKGQARTNMARTKKAGMPTEEDRARLSLLPSSQAKKPIAKVAVRVPKVAGTAIAKVATKAARAKVATKAAKKVVAKAKVAKKAAEQMAAMTSLLPCRWPQASAP